MNRYLVMVMRTPAFDPDLVPAHAAFLVGLRQRRCLELAGPFTDHSGGAYLLLAENRAAAESVAFSDPLHTSGASLVSVHEWNARQ